MYKSIHQPHDKLFKLSMAELSVARDFFKTHLPAKLLSKINLDNLKLENKSFVDEAYKATEADIVYSVTIGNSLAYLYLLCEHQSEIDRLIAFRLLVYSVRVMEQHGQQYPDSSLPLVYPLIIYTGEKTWNAPLNIFPLFGAEENLAREWFLNSYQLLDVHRIDDDTLLQQAGYGLVAFALKCRRVRDFAHFIDKISPWIMKLEQQNREGTFLAGVVLKYVLDGVESGQKELFLNKITPYLSEDLRGEMMTIAQQLRQEGFQKGVKRGMQQGVRKGEVAVVIRLLEHRFGQVSSSYIQKIKQADSEALLYWVEKILKANALEEIFESAEV